jgi:hypothetical protein
MYLRIAIVLQLVVCSLSGANVSGNQAEANRAMVLQSWKHRVDLNHGVHAWTREHDCMRVFQEWIAMLTLAGQGTPEVRRQAGLKFEKYVVGGNIEPTGFIGTSLPVPGYDQGDFDMVLVGCSSLLGLFKDDPLLLTDATMIHLIKKLVRTWGQTPKANFDVLFVSLPETENHLFMTESTRYLTNQLIWENGRRLPELSALRDSLVRSGVVIDNKEGMLRRLLLQVMHQAMCKGFFEFNAQVYQRFTIHALDNLYSFAHDRSINDGSACLLDYLSTVFAFQSYGSVRYGPYRRSSEAYEDSSLNESDAACSFFAVQSGAFPWNMDPRKGLWQEHAGHATMALISAVLKYRVPDPILQYMQERPAEYRAEIRSAYAGSGSRKHPTEVYYGARNFLVSAGGRYDSYSGPNFPTYRHWFSDAPWVYDIVTRSSSVILDPSRERAGSLLDILHFDGTQWRANNLAVHRNFLYGYSPSGEYNGAGWPQRLPIRWTGTISTTYVTRDFEFRFLDHSSAGVYVVLGRLRPSSTFFRWGYQKFLRGTIEMVDTSKVASLSALKDSVLARNSPLRHWPLGPRRYVYVDFSGDKIQLNPRYDGRKDGIVRVEEPSRAVTRDMPGLALPFPFPWNGDKTAAERPQALAGFLVGRPEPAPPLLQVDLYSPWKGKAALSDGQGNMYVFNPATGDYLVANFREWWNPRRMVHVQTLPDPPDGDGTTRMTLLH